MNHLCKLLCPANDPTHTKQDTWGMFHLLCPCPSVLNNEWDRLESVSTALPTGRGDVTASHSQTHTQSRWSKYDSCNLDNVNEPEHELPDESNNT